ncbi:GNAT family N-acyltransferase [Sporomusa acidovorans]|uniref:Cyclic nucleotide-binding domain-containing protein n=1 Tax=Sporomusa acidovorans (strain ATCC 49682 / DSM 3132 / Mol) TaxID=1123286 RepID=A0ABZ3J2G5_SPOA4|nr:GNAT family N-acyltransferase [Sporomusa acidovorans]OZC20039.1 cyclic nucleotide-binding domain protein [Sporomusa acidovorans DSM 3132]SDD46834.1 Cyclic nucleotide-binding domain-containing protein [Sporomusa acidovorans]
MIKGLQATETYKEELEKNFIVGLAKTAAEKQEIYAFRYQVYVEEMSRKLKSTEKQGGLLYDEMDDWSYLVYVKAGSQIVGAGRVSIGEIEEFPPDLIHLLSLDRFQKFYEGKKDRKFALSTKVAVAPNYRNSQVLYLLIAKGYELYCEHRVQFSFGGCNMYLLRLYEEVGVRRFGRSFADPGYGLITPIVWLVDDIEYMKKLHSPFYRLARKRQGLNKQVVDWFFKEFPEAINVINSRLITEEELWKVLSARLGNSPEKVMPILQGLSETEAMRFLHECGLVAQCYAGDRITTSGDPSNELNILLSGELQITNAGPSANRIHPGQHFGAVGLVDHTIHTQDIMATTMTDILVLSRICFPKFQRRYPAIAHQVLNNLPHITNTGRANDAKQA